MRDLNKKKMDKQETTDTSINVVHLLGSITRIMPAGTRRR